MDFISNHILIIMILIAFIVFAIIGYIIDTNNKNKQLTGTETPATEAEETPEIEQVVMPQTDEETLVIEETVVADELETVTPVIEDNE